MVGHRFSTGRACRGTLRSAPGLWSGRARPVPSDPATAPARSAAATGRLPGGGSESPPASCLPIGARLAHRKLSKPWACSAGRTATPPPVTNRLPGPGISCDTSAQGSVSVGRRVGAKRRNPSCGPAGRRSAAEDARSALTRWPARSYAVRTGHTTRRRHQVPLAGDRCGQPVTREPTPPPVGAATRGRRRRHRAAKPGSMAANQSHACRVVVAHDGGDGVELVDPGLRQSAALGNDLSFS